MRVVARVDGICIKAPLENYFSFTNSPYVGHSIGTSVDIYTADSEWESLIPSPVSGIVTRVKSIEMGMKKEFPTSENDFAIAIKPKSEVERIVRILHCRPSVRPGEAVSAGDTIGFSVRSRYFNYWTGPHYHVEVMNDKDFSRSTQSYRLTPEIGLVEGQYQRSTSASSCEVVEVSPDYIRVITDEIGRASSGDLHAHLVQVGLQEEPGMLDAGFPHYGFGGVFTNSVQQLDSITLMNLLIGRIETVHLSQAIFKNHMRFQLLIDGQPIRGISTFIYPRNHLQKQCVPLIIIPKEYGALKTRYKDGDILSLSIIGH